MSGEFIGYRKRSRIDFGSREESITLDQIKIGAILRIADATEVMAKNFTDLQQEAQRWEKRARDAEAYLTTLHRSNRALRACLRKAKR